MWKSCAARFIPLCPEPRLALFETENEETVTVMNASELCKYNNPRVDILSLGNLIGGKVHVLHQQTPVMCLTWTIDGFGHQNLLSILTV